MRFSKVTRNKRWIMLVAIAAIVIAILGGVVARSQTTSAMDAQQPRAVHIDEVARMAREGKVQTLTLTGDAVTASLVDGSVLTSRKETQVSILDTLRNYGVAESQLLGIGLEVTDPAASAGRSGTVALILASAVALVFIGGLVFITSRSGGAGRYGSFTRSGARMSQPDSDRSRSAPRVTFKHVAGADEAKQELAEVVEFLKQPGRFTALGATIPRGVLLVGPPGTGKTLLARAVAGEAGVPFLNISGSQFVEMFVGVGASRVRELFTRARKAAPCIVFIDEIDAVGRHRGGGMRPGHGSNDEREQTLNQILVEMDGFDARTEVVVIAATNRPDVLDEALLRPGRFDRQVMLDSPDVRGRRAILAIHSRGKPLAREVDLDTLARQTHGFSGADLANLMNEAAILAARRRRRSIAKADVEEAVDRCIAGPAKKSRVISERERRVIAYHELGHALVAVALPNCDPVHKVTIVGRGRAAGFTRFIPAEDRSLWTRSQFMDTLASVLGGHVAEQMVFGEVTTGASNDIERATELAQRMVCQYGMCERFGPMALGRADSGQIGRGSFEQRAMSDEMAREIDLEVRRIIDEARTRAREVLIARRDRLDRLTAVLLERETLNGDEFAELAACPLDGADADLEMEPLPEPASLPQADPVSSEPEAADQQERVSVSTRLARRWRLRPRPEIATITDRQA